MLRLFCHRITRKKAVERDERHRCHVSSAVTERRIDTATVSVEKINALHSCDACCLFRCQYSLLRIHPLLFKFRRHSRSIDTAARYLQRESIHRLPRAALLEPSSAASRGDHMQGFAPTSGLLPQPLDRGLDSPAGLEVVTMIIELVARCFSTHFYAINTDSGSGGSN